MRVVLLLVGLLRAAVADPFLLKHAAARSLIAQEEKATPAPTTPPPRGGGAVTAPGWVVSGDAPERVRIPPAASPPPRPTIPPTPAPRAPAKVPVVGPTECALFEAAIIVEPKPVCQYVVYASNWDGCMCRMVLPGSINPMPNTMFNPFAASIPPDPDMPTFPPMATVPPPSNPMQPYNPPMTAPKCPFADPCGDGDGFDCVGFNTWGFSEAHMGEYLPSNAHFNSMTCFYIAKPYDKFVVPKKIESFWHVQEKRGEAIGNYSRSISLGCGDKATTDTWNVFCDDMVNFLNTPCTVPWSDLWESSCKAAKPPEGFNEDSQLGELCPFECGFKRGEVTWPYPMATNASSNGTANLNVNVYEPLPPISPTLGPLLPDGSRPTFGPELKPALPQLRAARRVVAP